MVNVEVTTPAAAYLTAADLRTHLRLNDQGEDAQLTEFLAAAVERFEADTLRPILSTSYRQYLRRWPCEIVLGRGGISTITSLKRYTNDAGSVEDVVAIFDTHTAPARLIIHSPPDIPTNSQGTAISPVGYVDFTAGWASAAVVPKSVKVAILMLASHWYQHREEYGDAVLQLVPAGFARVAANFRLGLSGDWGQ